MRVALAIAGTGFHHGTDGSPIARARSATLGGCSRAPLAPTVRSITKRRSTGRSAVTSCEERHGRRRIGRTGHRSESRLRGVAVRGAARAWRGQGVRRCTRRLLGADGRRRSDPARHHLGRRHRRGRRGTAATSRCWSTTPGIGTGTSALAADAIEMAQREFDTNVLGPLAMSQAFAPVLGANGGGAIVNVLSVLSWLSAPPSRRCTARRRRRRGR